MTHLEQSIVYTRHIQVFHVVCIPCFLYNNVVIHLPITVDRLFFIKFLGGWLGTHVQQSWGALEIPTVCWFLIEGRKINVHNILLEVLDLNYGLIFGKLATTRLTPLHSKTLSPKIRLQKQLLQKCLCELFVPCTHDFLFLQRRSDFMNVTRVERLVYPVFVMAVQNLLRCKRMFYLTTSATYTSIIGKYFGGPELCNRMDRISVLCNCFSSSVLVEFCKATAFAISRIVEWIRSTCPFVVEWLTGVVIWLIRDSPLSKFLQSFRKNIFQK